MEIVEKIWEALSLFFGGLLRGFERGVTRLFGTSNARQVRMLLPKVAAINALEDEFKALSDEQLDGLTVKFKARLAAGETLDDLLVEAFAAVREAGRRRLGMRHYDVQMIGGMILHGGNIAEMVTGEGKTLVATLPAYLNALDGRGVHVVTVNDYLARRDMEWMGPLYMALGMSVGAIQSGMDPAERQTAYACDITYGTNNEFGFDYLRDNMRTASRGDPRFDPGRQQSQGPLHFAVIDEVDNILIDEARTPLIISGPAHDDVTKYSKADRIARLLKKDLHFEVKEKEHTVHLTEAGVREAERHAGVDSFYTAGNMEWPHLIDNSLKAHHLYKRDVNYIVDGDEIVIIDEFTGRQMKGRNWSDGLHQACEAKEGVRVKEENQTLATITLQNFFKLYKKLSGMTGTAMTEANEFWKIYKLDVVAVPTNRGMQRIVHPDVIFRTEREKYEAIVDEIERIHKWDVVQLKDGTEHAGQVVGENDKEIVFQALDAKEKQTFPRDKVATLSKKGRPILVGTVSIEKSERLSGMLQRRGVVHEVLNAKQHAREAEIIAQAGRLAAVTIATNMAGRGTDIILGGNPETMAWAKLQSTYATRLDVPRPEWEALVHEIESREKMKERGREIAALGGLHVLGTERHEARRIDLQLIGRCGRQGDPGSSRFFLSLEDDLMRIFAGEWVKNLLGRLGMQEGEAIESKMVSRRIEAAQKKVEERNFETRKNLLEYDEVMDEQRKRVYGYRQKLLEGSDTRQLVYEAVDRQVDSMAALVLATDFGPEAFAAFAGAELGSQFTGADFRGMEFEAAESFARDAAERQAETQVFDAIDENLPDSEEEEEWNWVALAHWANTRWGLNLRDKDLKKVGRADVSELLLEQARAALGRIDLSAGARYLDPDFGRRALCEDAKQRFDIELTLEDIRGMEAAAAAELVKAKAREAYASREADFPVMALLSASTVKERDGQRRYDRDAVVAGARARFGAELDLEDLKNKQRDEIRDVLVGLSRTSQNQAEAARASVDEKLDILFGPRVRDDRTAHTAGGPGAVASLNRWAGESLDVEWTDEDVGGLTRTQLEGRLKQAVEDRYRPEIRRMERTVILYVLDELWKSHLLAMDHLRSAVGLMGYAQVDPKVEYKREGMRVFETMWKAFDERVAQYVFRMENLSEDFVGGIWRETEARHDRAENAAHAAAREETAAAHEAAAEQTNGRNGSKSSEQAARDSAAQTERKPEPIRNRGQKIGRNDPCFCGSGKKYKNCHMKDEGRAGNVTAARRS